MNDIEKAKGWLGVFLSVWPIVRILLNGFGVDLPDLGGGHIFDALAPISQTVGVAVLAKSKPLGKPKS